MPLERELWFYTICAVTMFGIVWGLRDTRRTIEAPFLYAAGMAILMCPQLYVVANNPWRVPVEAFRLYSIIVILCSVGFYLGYFSKIKHRPNRGGHVICYQIDAKRLFWLGTIIGGVGTIGALQLREMGEVAVWRGWAVYWYTLSKLVMPGISLTLIAYFKIRKKRYLIISLLFSIIPLLAIVTAGRRSATIVLPLMYLLPFMLFRKRFRVPRIAFPVVFLFVFIVVYALPYWRSSFPDGRYLQAISEQPLSAIMEDIFSGKRDKTLETIDSIHLTWAHWVTGYYNWGVVEFYNQLIQNYVPGSLIGYDFKNALFIGSGIRVDWVGKAIGTSVAYYTGKSSYAEFFGAFWFFGAFLFYVIAKMFRRIRDAIRNKADGRAIIFLCFFITVPASLPWSQFILGLTIQVPNILIMLFAFRWCLHKQYYQTSDKPPNTCLQSSQQLVGKQHQTNCSYLYAKRNRGTNAQIKFR